MDIEDDGLTEASSKPRATTQEDEDSNGADARKEMACSLDSACRLYSALESGLFQELRSLYAPSRGDGAGTNHAAQGHVEQLGRRMYFM
jgi:hypothetical protein